MDKASVLLTKFDVAERQLNQAIILFFEQGDPVSVHTLAEAASQILYDLRGQFNATSIFRDSDRIREEHKKEWLGYLFKSRNFFKHANRDGNEIHEFKEAFNHYSLLDAVNMYSQIKKKWTPESTLFQAWFSLAHPNLINEESEFGVIAKRFREGPGAIHVDQRELFAKSIRMLRTGEIRIPGICIEPGLPSGT